MCPSVRLRRTISYGLFGRLLRRVEPQTDAASRAAIRTAGRPCAVAAHLLARPRCFTTSGRGGGHDDHQRRERIDLAVHEVRSEHDVLHDDREALPEERARRRYPAGSGGSAAATHPPTASPSCPRGRRRSAAPEYRPSRVRPARSAGPAGRRPDRRGRYAGDEHHDRLLEQRHVGRLRAARAFASHTVRPVRSTPA
jgi:hypothetical protein